MTSGTLQQSRESNGKAYDVAADGATAIDHLLSWQGLEVPIREDWRPLRIEGGHQSGSITIGDMNGPIFQLRWLRPPKGYDGKAWIEGRRQRTAGGQKSARPPRPAGFSHVSWIKDLSIREESQKTVWWGCAKTSEVLVEILLTNLCDPAANRWFVTAALPKLKAFPPAGECRWQIYSSRFVIPSKFVLSRKRLAAGDIALEFTRATHEKLIVRQVFPAGLALQRRSLSGWLTDRAFKESRRLRKEAEDAGGDRRVKWSGWKKLPMPLGWIMPRRCEAVVVLDTDLDRLLIAELEWMGRTPVVSVDELAAGMKWSCT